MYNEHANRQMPHEYKRTFQSENNKENPKIENSNVQMLTKYKHVYNLKSVVVMYCRTTQLYKQNIINLIIKFSEENIKISNIAG